MSLIRFLFLLNLLIFSLSNIACSWAIFHSWHIDFRLKFLGYLLYKWLLCSIMKQCQWLHTSLSSCLSHSSSVGFHYVFNSYSFLLAQSMGEVLHNVIPETQRRLCKGIMRKGMGQIKQNLQASDASRWSGKGNTLETGESLSWQTLEEILIYVH